jgi:beta-glucanase (GH16 family)
MAIDPRNLPGTATITFADEFNSLSLWNGSAGTWATSPWYAPPNGTTMTDNGDQQWYINSNYAPTSSVKPWTVSSGVLSITGTKADPSIMPYINNYEYTSGMINSYYSFSQTYGYFEMSAQLPKGQGFWPAFWLLPTNGAWPPEIDIMEVLGNDTTTIIPAMHSMATGVRVPTGGPYKVADLSVGFHTFGLNWASDYITWYVDGNQIMQAPTPSDLHSPMYMIANLVVGSGWSGPVDATTPLPSSFKIDYIRVYQDLGGAPPSPPSGPPPTTPPPSPPPGPPPPPTDGLMGTARNDTLRGTSGDDSINGLGGADKVYGNAGDDSISGGPGSDYLYGGPGVDLLTGDAGRDNFMFNEALNSGVDHITDFLPVDDTIRLDNAVFTALTTRKFSSGAFYSGPAAHDATDRIIYDPETGALLYDSDGTGPAAAVQFAELGNGLAVTARDFYIV